MVAKKNIVIKQREGECCGGGEKNDFKFKVSSRFPVAPHETLSPQSEPPPATAYLHTHTLSFSHNLHAESIQWLLRSYANVFVLWICFRAARHYY